jgi:hypothetical protein
MGVGSVLVSREGSELVSFDTRSPSPYLTTAEAAAFLRYRGGSGIRTAVKRGELRPAGRGPRGTHMFTPEELTRFVRDRAVVHAFPRRRLNGEATPGDNGDEVRRFDEAEAHRPRKGPDRERNREQAARSRDEPIGPREAMRSGRSRAKLESGWGMREMVERWREAQSPTAKAPRRRLPRRKR